MRLGATEGYRYCLGKAAVHGSCAVVQKEIGGDF